MGIIMKKQIGLLILSFFIAIATFSQEKKYTTYRVVDNETISSISRKLGITPYDLLKLNPDAKDGINIDEVLIIPNVKYKKKTSEVRKSETIKEQEAPKKIELVKKVKLERDSIKNGILYHTVRPQETVYSLCKKYKISKRKARKLNKLRRKSVLSVGQVLKFPTKLQDTKPVVVIPKEPEYDTKKYVGYTVKQYDTFYSLTRKYNVTKQQIIHLNPQLEHGLKVEDFILIPRNTEVVIVNESIEPTYKIHKVVAKEGFYRLKQTYGVSEEELIRLNPELKNGLKVGMEIKIPVKKEEENLMYEGDIQGKELNVVIMLPFKADDNSKTFAKSKLLNRVTDFYLGAMIALEKLKEKGLSVNVKVFDTKNNSAQVATILNSYDFSKTDVIIGPLFYSKFKEVATKLRDKNVPLISPLSKKDHGTIAVKSAIQNNATKTQMANKMLSYIKERYTNQNLMIITDKKTKDNANIIKVKSYLQNNNTAIKIPVLYMKDGYIKRELFAKNIKNKKENWVILVSDSEATSSVAVDNLGVYEKEYKITLFGLKKPKNIDKIKTHFLNRLTFHYPSTNLIDEESEEISKFQEIYKTKYGALPSDFSYKGYDTTYDALLRLANNYDISKAFQEGKSKRLESKFSYIINPLGGYYNDGVFIVKYDNYRLKEAK